MSTQPPLAYPQGMVLTVTVNPALDRVALVRNFVQGGMLRPRRLLVAAGGSGVHAARVARILGKPAVIQGMFGGYIGRLTVDLAQAEGLTTEATEIASETRINYVIVDQDTGYRLEIAEPGPAVTADEVEHLVHRYREAVGKAAVVVLSSGLPPGCPESVYADLIHSTPPGVPVIVDTHSGALESAWDARPEFVKVNESEFLALLGTPDTVLATPQDVVDASATLRPGARWLAVTLADRGAILIHGPDAWHCLPPAVGAFNPSGSGDAFVGALASSLGDGTDPVDSFVRATAAGTGNVRGLPIGYCDPAELAELLSQSTLTRIDRTCIDRTFPQTLRSNR